MGKLITPALTGPSRRTAIIEDGEQTKFRDRLVRAGVAFVKPARFLRGENAQPNFVSIVSGSITVDLRDVKRAGFYTLLTEDVTFEFPDGAYTGAFFVFVAQQDGTGSRTFTPGGGVTAGDGGTTILSAANAVTVYECFVMSPTNALLERRGGFTPAGPLHA